MNNEMPNGCANIYKHGRLKTIKEMVEDGTITPVPQELIDRIKKLTEGVDVNLDESLNDD